MKIAFLVQCHKDPVLINKLISTIRDENADIYVHVDKRSDISKGLLKAPNIYYVQDRFEVNWGSVNQVYATLELLKQVANKEYDYISLISGQDFPIKSNNTFLEFLEDNKGKEFIEYFKLPNENWSYEGGVGRVKYYWLDFLTPKRSFMWRVLRNVYLLTLGKLLSKDISSLGNLYGGSQWFTITGELATYIIEFLNNKPSYLNLYEHTGCADEIFFQTLIMNSPFKDKVVNDNLRFIKWEERQSSPKVLTIDDKTDILDSGKFFMRKVDSLLSKELISEFSKH